MWDDGSASYIAEDDSDADLLNRLIEDIARARPPARYHDNEDRLAHFVISKLKWPISKRGTFWVGADYPSIIEQGGFDDVAQTDLLQIGRASCRERVWRYV